MCTVSVVVSQKCQLLHHRLPSKFQPALHSLV
jgi:hypothetical protein